jgi:cysteine desulfurase
MHVEKIYLDHAATTPVLTEVFNAMKDVYLEHFGNASSVHSLGQDAKELLEQSRETVARSFGVLPEEIVFTGSGTEADNIAIQGTAFKQKGQGKGNHVITSNIEHPAVQQTCRYLEKFGFRITEAPVDEDGIVDLDRFQDAIEPETVLATVMNANNEIGTIQPIREIGEILADKGIIFHTDAVQAFGKIPINPETDGFQLLSASAHKIYGPKGVGILYLKGCGKDADGNPYLQPIMGGGGHESGWRSATENVPGIVGTAKAVEIAFQELEEQANRETRLRDRLIDAILDTIPNTVLNGHRTKRLPNNANISFEGVDGEALLLRLDVAGYEVSTGSACASHGAKASHVLQALGRDPRTMQGSLRMTIGRSTTTEQIEAFLADLGPIVEDLRALSQKI